MKKVIMALAVLGACRTTSTTMGVQPTSSSGVASAQTSAGGPTGAADPQTAVRAFMTAAKRTDLQAIGSLWGDAEGLARERLTRDELEKRELVMMRCLRHDTYEIVGDAPALAGTRTMVVQVNYGEVSVSTDVQVVRGGGGRWFVRDLNLPKLQDICMSRS